MQRRGDEPNGRPPLLNIRKDNFDPGTVDLYFLTGVVDDEIARLSGYIEGKWYPHVTE